MSEVNAHHIEMAEQKLAGAVRVQHEATGMEKAVFNTARVDAGAFERFLSHHWETLHARLPDIDPRLEPFVNTHLRHFFCVGVLAEREREVGT